MTLRTFLNAVANRITRHQMPGAHEFDRKRRGHGGHQPMGKRSQRRPSSGGHGEPPQYRGPSSGNGVTVSADLADFAEESHPHQAPDFFFSWRKRFDFEPFGPPKWVSTILLRSMPRTLHPADLLSGIPGLPGDSRDSLPARPAIWFGVTAYPWRGTFKPPANRESSLIKVNQARGIHRPDGHIPCFLPRKPVHTPRSF